MTRAASMLVLALDTTTRAGSLALARDGQLLDARAGDAEQTHAARLPGDILDILGAHGLTLADVDVYAVAAGPGSFTGLRIGIATVQGLAFAHGRRVVAVSALDALAWSARPGRPVALVAAWMDARRGEVFASLYAAGDHDPRPLAGPEVGGPAEVLGRWGDLLGDRPAAWIGDGAILYGPTILAAAGGREWVVEPAMPALAPAIAALAVRRAEAGGATPPHAVRPLYVRRPDAELARERRLRAGETS